MEKAKPTSVMEYIDATTGEVKERLLELRGILREVAPDATESLKWGSPVFEEKRILFSFSAFKSHINFMPTHSAMIPFEKELTDYKTGKDTIQFPYSKPLPKALIKKIAAYRVKEVKENGALWMTRK